MLKLWTAPDEQGTEWYEKLFLDRYDRVATWALQLTKGRVHQAQDLVQEAFVFLIHSKPDFGPARNMDAYLYGILRNLHRAQLHRTVRRHQMSIPIVEFESAEWGLSVLADEESLLEAQNNLRRICHFACHRKETTKAGSILILRFFHGYYAAEIAAIARSSRDAVDERLRQARREARTFLDDPAKFQVLGVRIPLLSGLPNSVSSTESLLAELKLRIFGAASGNCLSRSQVREIYGSDRTAASGTAIDQSALAHIVSCQKCLEAIGRRLRLPPLSGRNPNDTAGYDTTGYGSAPGASRIPGPRSRLPRWKRVAEGILQHEPRQLWIAVNGQPMGFHTIVGGDNDFAVTFAAKEDIEFVEILSEQQVRLLLMPVRFRPPEGDPVQQATLTLSEGRMLTLKLSFDSPWPAVHLSYTIPAKEARECQLPEQTGSIFENLLPKPRFSWTRFASAGLVLVLILALLFVQNRENTASAAVIVERALAWERARADRPGSVLHRSFDFIERKHGGRSIRRRVEVWRHKNAKISRLFDSSGELLGTNRLILPLPRLSVENVWQFDPAADTYASLAGDLRSTEVSAASEVVELRSHQIDLWVDKASYRPIREDIRISDVDFEFRETSTETIPNTASPFYETSQPIAAVKPPMDALSGSWPATVRGGRISESELDDSEAALWTGLHAQRADLGEELHIRRRVQEIELAGVVDSEARKRELIASLETIPHVRISLLSPEDVTVSSTIADNARSALVTPPDHSTSLAEPLLSDWLAQHHPDATERQAWVGSVLKLTRDCLGHTYALRVISDRFPNPNRAEILRIERDHQRQLRETWMTLLQLWQPVTRGVGVDMPRITPSTNFDYSTLFFRMRSFQNHILRLFVGDVSSAADIDLFSEIRLTQEDAAAIEAETTSF